MSTLVVEVCDVKSVEPHPNADRLDVIVVKGWRVIVGKTANLKVGDKVVYIPPDSVISEDTANRLGILKYVTPTKDSEGKIAGYRIRAARLRGEPSYGTVDLDVPEGWEIGKDVREILGITKWEPPLRCHDGDAERDHPAFHKYTDMENIRNFPDVIKEGEDVVVSEKLHGMNARFGLLNDSDEKGEPTSVFACGSHAVRRKEFDAKGNRSAFWETLSDPLRRMLIDLREIYDDANVIAFGELINTQKGFLYGLTGGEKAVRIFDISVNGRYLDHAKVKVACEFWGVPMVPILYEGPFSWAVLEQLTCGPTTMCEPKDAGKFKGREGVVIKPTTERTDPGLPGSGRVILKSISADYLEHKTGKGGDDSDVSDA